MRERVQAAKTLALCACPFKDARLLPWPCCRVFPLGAVPKPLEPDTVRPVSDHTKSGLKAATDDEELKQFIQQAMTSGDESDDDVAERER